MNRYLQYFTVIAFAALMGGCERYAKFAIDKEPTIKIDSSLLGSWKAVEDTDKKNFILVQSSYDNFRHIARWHNMDSSEKGKLFMPELRIRL